MQELRKAGTQATVKDPDGKGGLSIALNQPKGSNARWRFSVRAITDMGEISIGEFTSSPPANNRLSRFVAIANCPGAISWSLMINLASGDEDGASVVCSVGYMTSEPGLTRIAERYKQYEDSAPGVVNVLAGETVLGWTASADAAGGTVTIDGFGVITVAPSGAISGGGGGLIEGPVTFTFAGGINSYLIEVAESA